MNVLVSSWYKVPDHAIFVIIHSFLSEPKSKGVYKWMSKNFASSLMFPKHAATVRTTSKCNTLLRVYQIKKCIRKWQQSWISPSNSMAQCLQWNIPIDSPLVRFITIIVLVEFLSRVTTYSAIEFLSIMSLILCLISFMCSKLSFSSTPLTVAGS